MPKCRLCEYATIIIAALAFVVSIYSICLSTRDFVATHRPYVYGISRKMTQNDKTVMDLNTVLLPCFNAPAKVTNRKFYYLAIKTRANGTEDQEIKFEKNFTNEIVLYPTDTPTSQITVVGYDFKKEILEKDPKVKLRRKVRVDYKELSSDRTYYFEGDWDYNRQYDVWEDSNMSGN
jgi:hypothetical protein